MVIQWIAYLLLAIYLNNILPNEVGARRPWYYPLLPSYWRPRPAAAAAALRAVADKDGGGGGGGEKEEEVEAEEERMRAMLHERIGALRQGRGGRDGVHPLCGFWVPCMLLLGPPAQPFNSQAIAPGLNQRALLQTLPAPRSPRRRVPRLPALCRRALRPEQGLPWRPHRPLRRLAAVCVQARARLLGHPRELVWH